MARIKLGYIRKESMCFFLRHQLRIEADLNSRGNRQETGNSLIQNDIDRVS